jgi:glycolate oxidase
MLLIEVDGEAGFLDHEVEKIRRACLEGGAGSFEVASDAREAEKLWEARRNVSPSLYKLRPNKISEDIVVPRSRMAEMVDSFAEMGNRTDLPIAAFGHAGDGNLHVNVMFDEGNLAERVRARSLVREIFGKVIEMRGTISGEHGIGITKAPYLEMEIEPVAMGLMQRIKQAFDPRGILNPGKIFPPEEPLEPT